MIAAFGVLLMIFFNIVMFSYARAAAVPSPGMISQSDVALALETLPVFIVGNVFCAVIILAGVRGMADSDN